jgi:excisionase family DNA binding protein
MPKASTALLTIQQAADQLQLCPDTVRRAIWRGVLVAHRFEGSIRISQADLDDFVAKGRGIRVKPHRRKEPLASSN